MTQHTSPDLTARYPVWDRAVRSFRGVSRALGGFTIRPTGGFMSDQLPLEAYWMPYTGNRQFKRDPRIIVAAQDDDKAIES